MQTSLNQKRRALLIDLLQEEYCQEWHVRELSRQFARNDYVRLPDLFSPTAFEIIREEAIRLGDQATPRDFIMPGVETPRRMSTISGEHILSESELLWSLYANHALRSLLAGIAGGAMYPCLHPSEFMVINYLFNSGATHGWHLDDPAYALIVVFEAPPEEKGGSVELIPDWHQYCRHVGRSPNENVEDTVALAQEARLVQSRYHAPGDAYLLRADTSLHRVTALKDPAHRRIALNLGFESTPNPRYGGSADLLYGDS